jgi:hypothetical protein
MCDTAPPKRGRNDGFPPATAAAAEDDEDDDPPLLLVVTAPSRFHTSSTPSNPPLRRQSPLPGAHARALTPAACQCSGWRRRTPFGAGAAVAPLDKRRWLRGWGGGGGH